MAANAPPKWTLLAILLPLACGEPPRATFDAAPTAVDQELSADPGFADQSGGGLFLREDGVAIRIRLDGSVVTPFESVGARLACTTSTRVNCGKVRAIFPFGPHAALVAAANGLYLAQGGFVIALPWGDLLPADGVIAAARSSDGGAWIAHQKGLFRVKDGTLAELRAGDGSIADISAVALAPAEDGAQAIWYLHGGVLSVAEQTSKDAFTLVDVDPGPLGPDVKAIKTLTAIAPSGPAPGELWLATEAAVWRKGREGWQSFPFGSGAPPQLVAAGRSAWVLQAGRLLRFDADRQRWQEGRGLDAPSALLAADEAGAVWVRQASGTVLVNADGAPHLTGLDQGLRLSDDSIRVRALFAPGQEPAEVHYRLAGEEVIAPGPEFSLGGLEADGSIRPYLLTGLGEGPRELFAIARYADGREAVRSVPFDFRPPTNQVFGYAQDIQPIMDARCARCHLTGPGRDLSTYELWVQNQALIVAAVREQRMPADGPLDPALILNIQRWASSGAKP